MAGKRAALIVANSEYHDEHLQPLRSPEIDAEALRRVLADPEIGGYDVEVCPNAPKHELEPRLDDFFKDREPDDLLLLHLSCHGVKDDDGQLYFATPNTVWERFDSTAVSADWVRAQMDKSRSRRIVLLLDCCYSGRFPEGKGPRAAGAASVDIKERFAVADRAHVVLTASTSLQYSYEGTDLTTESEPSFFTAALVRGLESGAGSTGDWISIDDLWEHVRRDLLAHNPKQTPQRYVSGEQLLIARNPRPGLSRTVAERQHRALPRDYRRLAPLVRLEGGGDELYSVAISSTGRAVAAGTDGAVLVWRSEEEIKTWAEAPEAEELRVAGSADPLHASYVYTVAFSPAGDAVASGGEDGVVRVTGLDGRELLRKTRAEKGHDEAVYSVAFSPDGRYLASGSWDRRVIVWNLATGMVHREHAFSGRISSVAFPTDEPVNRLAIGSLDNRVALWNVDGGKPVDLEAGHVSSVEAVALSYDGKWLASCGLDKTVRLWDVEERKPAWPDVEPEHEYLVRTVAFAPGGATLVSASWDKAMKLWDVSTGAVSQMPSYEDWEHSDWIWSVAFSPDGLLLASAASDSTILVWTLPADD